MTELKIHRDPKKRSSFIDDVMEGAEQLSDKELIKLGSELKKGRHEKLKSIGER